MSNISRAQLRPFEVPSLRTSLVQAALSFACFGGTLAAGFWFSGQTAHLWAWPLAAAATLVAAVFLERIFIIQHDCGHGSYFSNPRLNRLVGRLCTLFTLTPFRAWAMEHNVHHATFGNLDNAGTGEMPLMEESRYRNSPWYVKLGYRIFRNPVFMVTLLPYAIFLLRNRWTELPHKKAILSAILTNLTLLVLYALVVWLAPLPWVAVMLGVWYVAGLLAVILFYLQHNFEEAQYYPGTSWSYETACTETCSFLILPYWLDWATGFISHHHLHHLSSKIPFYNLPAAQAALGAQIPATQLRLRQIPRLLKLALWCPASKRVVPFGASLAG